MDRPELLGTKLFDLSGQAALVTGAGRGLGRTMALALAAAGADVAVTSRTSGEIQGLSVEIKGLGRRSVAVSADATVEGDVARAVEVAVDALGKVDILVNNAGINVRKPVLEMSEAEYRSVLDTNLVGYFHFARAAGAGMVARGSGKVVNVSSIMGSVALANQAAYSSSKGAIDQLTKVLALEWASANVQVNGIAPAYFETELTRALFDDPERREFITGRTPMGRWGQPHELAGAVIFLASRASSYVTGHTLMVDGGWTAW